MNCFPLYNPPPQRWNVGCLFLIYRNFSDKCSNIWAKFVSFSSLYRYSYDPPCTYTSQLSPVSFYSINKKKVPFGHLLNNCYRQSFLRLESTVILTTYPHNLQYSKNTRCNVQLKKAGKYMNRNDVTNAKWEY